MVNPSLQPVRSIYWEWKAREIAFEHNETCKHMFDYLPIVYFKYQTTPEGFYSRYKIKCGHCKQKFPTTEKILKDKFKEFYEKL